MKNIFTYIIILLLSFNKGYAQQLIGTAGTTQNNVSWSIGELVNETGTTNNLIVVQGFNQQAEGVISAIGKLTNSIFSFYPNPVVEKLRLSMETNNSYAWKLTDLTGRVLKQKTSCIEMEIDMADMAAGQYILSVLTDEFKQSVIVIKN
jgi:hypothetical protein